jgi:hypothetical protein
MGILEGTGVLVALDTQRESFSHLYVPPPLEGVRVCGEQRDLIRGLLVDRAKEKYLIEKKLLSFLNLSTVPCIQSYLTINH